MTAAAPPDLLWAVGIPLDQPGDVDKTAWRRWAIDQRRARSAVDRSAARRVNRDHLLDACRTARTVCAFLPLASEPLDPGLLDDLGAARVEVLIPQVEVGRPLDWCRFPSPLIAGGFGIAEPAGPSLGAHAIIRADLVLVPAFAVDRCGVRLGRGGGHYDRSLALPGISARLVAVLFDGEAVHQLPTDPHDVPVTEYVCPGQGLVNIAATR